MNGLRSTIRSVGLLILLTLLVVPSAEASSDDTDVANASAVLAEVSRLLAEKKHHEAVSILEVALSRSTDPTARQSLLLTQSRVHQRLGEDDRAVEALEGAIELSRQLLGPEHLGVATLVGENAALEVRRGNLARSEQLYREALSIYEARVGGRHVNAAYTLLNLAEIRRRRGDLASAQSFGERGLAVFEAIRGPEHPQVSAFAILLGEIAEDRRDFRQGFGWYERALALEDAREPPDLPKIGHLLDILVNNRMVLGDMPTAITLCERALGVKQRAYGADHPEIAWSWMLYGNIFASLGNYYQARAHFQKALENLEGTPSSPYRPSVLTSLAKSLTALGEFEAARDYLERALEAEAETPGADSPASAGIYSRIGRTYLYQERGEQARIYFEKALALAEKNRSPSLGVDVGNLGWAHEILGDFEKAKTSYERAIRLIETELGVEHHASASWHIRLSVVNAALGDGSGALAALHRGLDSEERQMLSQLVAGSEAEKSVLMFHLVQSTNFSVDFQLRFATDDASAAVRTLTTILRRKGWDVATIAEALSVIRRRPTVETAGLITLWQVLLEGRASRARSGDGDGGFGSYVDRQITRHAEAVLSERALPDAPGVAARLPDDAALVEFVAYRPLNATFDGWGGPRYAAYVLRADGSVGSAGLGDAEAIDREIVALRRALSAPHGSWRKPARTLAELVLEPLAPHLEGVGHLLISPDGQLNLVPFGVLLGPQERTLLERSRVTYLTSGRDLLRAPATEPGTSVVIAGPDFDTTLPGKEDLSRARDDVGRHFEFSRLAGAEAEGRAIAKQIPDATLLIGKAATRSALMEVRSPRILHVATHGFFLSGAERPVASVRGAALVLDAATAPARTSSGGDPLLRSGLAFAGANRGGGIVTALEASSLDLVGTQLVVLSACETGVGEARNSRGVYGLRRALAVAGAETQVMSLWKVPDEATRDLMVAYHGRLAKGEGRSEALRQTQLEMRASEERSHPFHWASFIPIGDWRPLRSE